MKVNNYSEHRPCSAQPAAQRTLLHPASAAAPSPCPPARPLVGTPTDNYGPEFEHSDTMLRELQDDTRENYQAALTDQIESRLLDGSPGPLLQIVRCRCGLECQAAS
eukprot:COSAG01_NODE_43539_length_428_cov_15.313070_1_plen_107_part_00